MADDQSDYKKEDVDALYEQFQEELGKTAERIQVQYATFKDAIKIELADFREQQEAIDRGIYARIGETEMRLAKLETKAGLKHEPVILDADLVGADKHEAYRAMERTRIASLKAATTAKEAQLAGYNAADALVGLMKVEGVPKKYRHLTTAESVAYAALAAVGGAAAASAAFALVADRRMRKAGVTTDEVNQWLTERAKRASESAEVPPKEPHRIERDLN